MAKKFIIEKPAPKKFEIHKETGELTPDKKLFFGSILKDGADNYYFDFEIHSSFGHFVSEWERNNYVARVRMLKSRNLWIDMNGEGQLFENFITAEIVRSLDMGPRRLAYKYLEIYFQLSYPKDSKLAFLGQIINRQDVWQDSDGSFVKRILENFTTLGDPASIGDIAKFIQNALSPEYNRKEFMDMEINSAVRAMRRIIGQNATIDLLRSLAQDHKTFAGWFKTSKLIHQYLAENEYDDEELVKYEPEAFDRETELQRLKDLEKQLNQKKPIFKNKPDNPTFEFKPLDKDALFIRTTNQLEREASKWETKKLTNFYGRFKPQTENGVALTGDNYLSALQGVAGIQGDARAYLNLLSGVVEKNILPAKEAKKLNAQELYKISILGVGEVLCAGILNGEREGSIERLDDLKTLVLDQDPELEDLKEYILRGIDQARDIIFATTLPELPKSADAFLIYHAWFNKAREMPDFRTLLAEKIRWIMANELSNNLGNLEFDERTGLPRKGPSFIRLMRIAEEYRKKLNLYEKVEENDVPIYWEAVDKLEDTGAQRVVVFGRDGRAFFIALKAGTFGVGDKDIKYIVLTRLMQDKEYRKRITEYLKQNGLSLDFTFIDTGYRGSMPELAIDLLAADAGVRISRDEVDRRINLLASSKQTRTELSRHRRDENVRNAAIEAIEESRPQNMESPAELVEDENGKLYPKVRPNPISAQLGLWVVEHAALRNFAPRLNPEKRMEYIKSNPLKGLTYIQDYAGESIGTHPMELWEDEDKKKFLIKGGPEHTLRADFVGQRFLDMMGLKVPDTELIEVDGQLKLKMEFLEDYKIGGLHLPQELHDSIKVQDAILVDALLGQYDRTPWNLMFKKEPLAYQGISVAFIDNGAGLFSRAKGGHKGFPEHFDLDQLAKFLANPQFPGQPVNEAYLNLLEVKNGKLDIKNPDVLRGLLGTFEDQVGDNQIDEIVEQAGFPDGRRSVLFLENLIQQLEEELRTLPKGSTDYAKTLGAIETYKKAIEAGGENSYLKKALRQRRNDIVEMFKTHLNLRRSFF